MKYLDFFLKAIKKILFMVMGIASQQSARNNNLNLPIIESAPIPQKTTIGQKIRHTVEVLFYGLAACVTLGLGATLMF